MSFSMIDSSVSFSFRLMVEWMSLVVELIVFMFVSLRKEFCLLRWLVRLFLDFDLRSFSSFSSERRNSFFFLFLRISESLCVISTKFFRDTVGLFVIVGDASGCSVASLVCLLRRELMDVFRGERMIVVMS